MSGIFISYRRSGASQTAYRLKDRLKEAFGPDRVFVDVEDIEAGLPFDQVIRTALTHCSIALIVIGPRWATMRDPDGQRTRLADPEDWVRREVELAMASGVRVIPLLVDGASMPDPMELPESLRPFARLQSEKLSEDETYWRYDMQRLIDTLERIDPGLKRRPDPPAATRPQPFSGRVVGGLILLAMVVLGVASETPDRDTAIGALALSLIGLGLCIWGYVDIRTGRTRGRAWAITGIVAGVLLSLAGFGWLAEAPPTVGTASAPADSGMASVMDETGTPAVMPATPDLTGIWASEDGYLYQLSQVGSQVHFVGIDPGGQPASAGAGQLQGRTLSVRFTATDPANAAGSGRLVLSPDGRRLSGQVSYQPSGAVETVVLHRQQ